MHIVKPDDVVVDDSKGTKRKREPDDSTNKKRKIEPTGAPGSGGKVKVRVANLAFSLDGREDEIREQFKTCGTITNIESISKSDGRFAGVFIVEFESGDAAAKALEFHDQLLYERPMNVSYSEERKARTNFISPKPDGCTTCFIGNLSYEIEEGEVYEFFKDCGEVVDVRWPRGDFTGIGWVEFSDTSATDLAVAKSGVKIRGRDIRVDYAKPKVQY